MKIQPALPKLDLFMLSGILFLIILSVFILNSILPSLFPLYFLYIVLGILAFFFFLQIDFNIVSLFSRHLYFFSILFLLLPLLIGQVTRGAVRWIPLGALTIQPAEIVRPFLLVFFAAYLTKEELSAKRLLKALLLLSLPVFLIVIQPSLGVGILTTIGFLGVVLATTFDKKYLFFGSIIFFALIPLIWRILAPYQKDRIISFVNPASDPYGAGYNSIQSMISVGSGKLFGRGLGKGVQTQLAFLPERHTDFIFAAVSEELGFIGASLLLIASFVVIWRLVISLEEAKNPTARAFASGFILMLFVQTLIHIGMNMGLLPITGIPLPLVSAGGSSFLATMVGLAMVIRTRKEVSS